MIKRNTIITSITADTRRIYLVRIILFVVPTYITQMKPDGDRFTFFSVENRTIAIIFFFFLVTLPSLEILHVRIAGYE